MQISVQLWHDKMFSCIFQKIQGTGWWWKGIHWHPTNPLDLPLGGGGGGRKLFRSKIFGDIRKVEINFFMDLDAGNIYYFSHFPHPHAAIPPPPPPPQPHPITFLTVRPLKKYEVQNQHIPAVEWLVFFKNMIVFIFPSYRVPSGQVSTSNNMVSFDPWLEMLKIQQYEQQNRATRRATLLRCKLQSECCSYYHPARNKFPLM